MTKKFNLLTMQLMLKEGFVGDYLNNNNPDFKELKSLSKLVDNIKKNHNEFKIFNDYFYDYTIPQISKQFDLLKIGKDIIINIELKQSSTEERIKNQLMQNMYYLKSTGKEVYTFTYLESTNTIFQYVAFSNKLIKINFEEFVRFLEKTEVKGTEEVDINSLFTPKEYLVSVFNNTKKFNDDEYFLNDLQQRFKKEFRESDKLFRAIKGGAGTGKSLMLYDIAKEYKNQEHPILVIHCARLNIGHSNLQQLGWNITQIKDYSSSLNPDLKAIFIDEAQRLTKYQFDEITKFSREHNIYTYFSYDPEQYLHLDEKTSDIANKILGLNSEVINRSLTQTIRSCEEINLFVTKLFDNNHNHTTKFDFRDFIEVLYFDTISTANLYVDEMVDSSKGEATVLSLTDDLKIEREYQRYNNSRAKLNAHQVIGQEFSHVVLVLGNYVAYNSEGKLFATCSSYYDVERMIYQLATRCKEKLTLVVINNKSLAKRAVKVLNQ